MRRLFCFGLFLLALVPASWADDFNPQHLRRKSLCDINRRLCGRVLDFTHNHGCDRRIYSSALCDQRDLYVYLPPGYDPSQKYPVLVFLHGISGDETSFLEVAPMVDRAMVCGKLPQMIFAVPDGTTRGHGNLLNAGSFYINSKAGRFEDYIIQDVWPFVRNNFPIRPEREYHVIAGASMGGFGAYNLAIKHRDQFGVVAGLLPPLHLRYLDCHGRYFADYDPECLGIRERLGPMQPIGRFFGVIAIRERRISTPLYGRFNRNAIHCIAQENPFEMLDTYCVKPGELDMFVGYGKRDNFNIDAQVEAFVDKARCMGLEITCICDPRGKHNTAAGERLFPAFCDWLTGVLNSRKSETIDAKTKN